MENYNAQILCMAGEQRMSPLVCPGWARAKRITAVPPAEAPRTKYTLDFQVVEQLDQRLHLVGRSSSASDIVATSSRSFRARSPVFPLAETRESKPSQPTGAILPRRAASCSTGAICNARVSARGDHRGGLFCAPA